MGIEAKTRSTAEPALAEQQPVTPKVPEFVVNRVLEQDLSYQDIEMPEDQKRSMLDWSRSSDSAKKYAESLGTAANTEGLEGVRRTARVLLDTMLSEANRLGIPVSPFGKSISWAMWDIGKQHHFFTHQEENNPGYEIGNPLESSEKKDEIVNRHLGWEAYAAHKADPSAAWAQSKPAGVLELLGKTPKENNTLSSRDLAELGDLLRK